VAITTSISSANILAASVDLSWTVSWGTGVTAPFSVTISGNNSLGTVYTSSSNNPTSGTLYLTTLTPGLTYIFTITASAYNPTIGETTTNTSTVTVVLRSNIKYWNGTDFNTIGVARYWTGAIWQEVPIKTYTGTGWV